MSSRMGVLLSPDKLSDIDVIHRIVRWRSLLVIIEVSEGSDVCIAVK